MPALRGPKAGDWGETDKENNYSRAHVLTMHAYPNKAEA